MCFFKIPEFRTILAIFGPVTAILDGQGTSLRGLHCSNQKVHFAKVAPIAFL